MPKRRGTRGARKRWGSRGAHRKGRHGGQRHHRSVEAKQPRAAKWTSELRDRLRGKVAHLPKFCAVFIVLCLCKLVVAIDLQQSKEERAAAEEWTQIDDFA